MQKTETRAVAVKYCDFCGDETQGYLFPCVCCKREMCSKDGMKAHAAYHIELYRYADAARNQPLAQHVCTECASKTLENIDLSMIFDQMMGPDPVVMLERVNTPPNEMKD